MVARSRLATPSDLSGAVNWMRSPSANKFEMGATPSISANGNKNAVVWAISTKVWNGADDKPAVLYAYAAIKLGPPLYTSEQNAARDRAPAWPSASSSPSSSADVSSSAPAAKLKSTAS